MPGRELHPEAIAVRGSLVSLAVCLRADLRGDQVLCEAGALLDEVLSGGVASAQVVLRAGLCGFHLIDFDRLLRQLPPEVCDRLVAPFDLCTCDLAVVD